MNVLLSISCITHKLCQSPQELSNDDLSDVDIALTYMTDAGFNMDWLEKKLEEVKEKKEKEEACLTRLQEMEESIKPLKQEFLKQEAEIDKEKAELLAARLDCQDSSSRSIRKQVNNTFTWVIKNVSTLQGQEVRSEIFVVGGCKWRLIAYPEVNNVDGYLSLSVYLDVPDCCESLPSGWKRHAKFSLTIVNQISEEFSQLQETQQWFDQNAPGWGFPPMLNLKDVSDKHGGFLVNDEVMVAVAVDVLEVVGSLDAPEKSESMDIKGFQVLPSQVESVNRLFERHPDIASKFSIKNQSLKTAYMNVLLCLNETLHQSPKEISEDDLSDAVMRKLLWPT
ncbi:hypothetical protein ARALYDRAFT_907302 [Arabidopsis lyrata subsp. lyrata]|uniref:MATH domain-containing protein n=1 Tax=Arabidopsis lyrata subsp. lyrata TaxID=81972 RepID=D7LW21_ARALL|nr:hypothetical protein ARALYDRAFT_907302 [Arabidopsis lyrata subsp. lyrata]